MNKFYLNGQINKKLLSELTGNNIINRGISYYKESFDHFEKDLREKLWEKKNAFFSMCDFRIFNPFGYFSPTFKTEKVRDWDWVDFQKSYVSELLNGYNYMVLLPNWWKCREARMLKQIADNLGIKAIRINKLLKELS